jgi:hypothetical protein
MEMTKVIQRPTHVRVIVAPKAGYLKLEGCAADATGTVFSTDEATKVYAFMVKKGKELKREVKVWIQTEGAKTPEVKFNKYDGSPYMALVSDSQPSRNTKVIL